MDLIFWPEEAEIIKRTLLCGVQSQDRLVWHYTRSGFFSVRSAYHVICSQGLLLKPKG